MFQVSATWKTAFPEAHAGVLVMEDVSNPARHTGLEAQKILLEQHLRERYSSLDRAQLKELPVLKAYEAYYRQFNKTYHVQLQLESIVFKGKALPSVPALVGAMFMAEVSHLLLTAGHDLDALQLPVTLDVSRGGERYLSLQGKEQELKPGDMFMSDQSGIISSILYGPDQRTQIRTETQTVVFMVYAPAGIREQEILSHLQEIQQKVLLVAPQAQVEMLKVFGMD